MSLKSLIWKFLIYIVFAIIAMGFAIPMAISDKSYEGPALALAMIVGLIFGMYWLILQTYKFVFIINNENKK